MLHTQIRVERKGRDGEGQADSPTRESRVSGGLVAQRRTETADTRLNTSIDLPATGSRTGRNVLGRLSLTQGLLSPRDGLTANLELLVDDNRGERLSATEELIGRRRRSTAAAGATWQHQISERLETQAGLNYSHTRFDGGAVVAEAFRQAQGSASASYRWDEVTRLTVQLSRSHYELDSGNGKSLSDSVSLSASRALTETASLSAGLGAYRNEQTSTLRGFACPLPVSFCDSGLVATVPVAQRLSTPTSGSQYSLNFQSNLGARTALAMSASRQLAGTGLGLVRSDSLSLNMSHSITPFLSAALTGSHSRTRALGAGNNSEPRVSGLEASLSWAWAERLVLRTTANARQLREPRSGADFASTQFSITLQYQGATIFSPR